MKFKCHFCKSDFEDKPSRAKKSRSGLYFCCKQHKHLAQRLSYGLKDIHPDHYGKGTGIESYRSKAFDAYGKRCQDCGYDQFEKMLDVHHKNGNRKDNVLQNLEVLCVWCHALKTRKCIKHGRLV